MRKGNTGYLFIALRCVVALGSTFAHVTWARDYFNPAFIENHGQASRTSVDSRHLITTKPAARHLLRHYHHKQKSARNVDFQLTTLSDGQQALQGCLRPVN